MAALLIPVLLFLFGVAFPLGWLALPGSRASARRTAPSHDPAWPCSDSACSRCSTGHIASGTRSIDGLQLKRFTRPSTSSATAVPLGSAIAGYLLLLGV